MKTEENRMGGRKVLVTGGTGLIGRYLVEQLLEMGAEVHVASLDDASLAHPRAVFQSCDLTSLGNCLRLCEGMDYVFHLAGVKGSPEMAREKPASFFVPLLLMNTNMMEAARRTGVRWYLYTSTIGVYGPAEVLREEDVWKTFPSDVDRFAGWAKRMGELQAEACRLEYGWDRVTIVRPANVYGPYDNFDSAGAMVIASLIRRAVEGENPLRVWGDGAAIRDFIHAQDVARGMLLAFRKRVRGPLNLGTGRGTSIRRLVEILLENFDPKPRVEWDSSKPRGDARRVLDTSRACAAGFEPCISLEQGIRETIEWYRSNRDRLQARHEAFRPDPKGVLSRHSPTVVGSHRKDTEGMFYQGKKVLVTGSSGLIGTHLVSALTGAGALVRAAYHKKPPLQKEKGVEYAPYELTHPQDCRRAVSGMQCLFHCAANTSGAAVMRGNPVAHITENLLIHSQILEAACLEKVQRLLFVSSSTVYPPLEHPMKEEEAFRDDPYEVYFGVGWMKRYTEKLCEFYFRRYGLQVALVRPTNVYGPGDKFDPQTSHVLPALIRRAVEKADPFEVWGDGNEVRDFVYVEDLVQVLLLALEKAADCRPVNFGSGCLVTIRESVEQILRLAGHSDVRVLYDPSRPTTIPKRVVDLTRVQSVLGYRARVSLEEGLRRTIRWYLQTREDSGRRLQTL